MEVLNTTFPKRNRKLIYLVTDGNFPDHDAVLKFAEENRKLAGEGYHRSININTYLFGANAPQAVRDVMKKIAETTNGVFKVVEEEMQKPKDKARITNQ